MTLKKNELARRLNIQRKTLDTYLNMADSPKAGPDGGYVYGEVLKFIEAAAKSDKTLSKSSPVIAELKRQELVEKIRKLRLANDHQEGGFIAISKAETYVAEAISTVFAELQKREDPLVTELESAVGESAKKTLLNASRIALAKDLKKRYGSYSQAVG